MEHVINVTAYAKKEKNIKGISRTVNKLIANENVVKSFTHAILNPDTIKETFFPIHDLKNENELKKKVMEMFVSLHKSLEVLTDPTMDVPNVVKMLISTNMVSFAHDYDAHFYLDFTINGEPHRLAAKLDAKYVGTMQGLIAAVFSSAMKLHLSTSVCNNESEICLYELKWLCIYYLILCNAGGIIPSYRILMFASTIPGIVLLRILSIVKIPAISGTANNSYKESKAMESIERGDRTVCSFIGFDGRRTYYNSDFKRVVRMTNATGQVLDMPEFIDDA
uniref:Uncharacterized protein n=1 Tax=Cacopsylla melanoneura TaxID=428564 RepID=A0A8D8ZCF8_9HEMI